MMSTELPVSTRVLSTLPVATFNVITKASSWGYEMPSASFSVKRIGGGWWGTFGVPYSLRLTSLPILLVIDNDLP